LGVSFATLHGSDRSAKLLEVVEHVPLSRLDVLDTPRERRAGEDPHDENVGAK